MRGRDSLNDHALWRWADEGERWLRNQFPDKGLEFHTATDIEKHTITLKVYKSASARVPAKVIFEVTEPAVSFVSHTTLTKIILIAG